jgi:hypothetical protein
MDEDHPPGGRIHRRGWSAGVFQGRLNQNLMIAEIVSLDFRLPDVNGFLDWIKSRCQICSSTKKILWLGLEKMISQKVIGTMFYSQAPDARRTKPEV